MTSLGFYLEKMPDFPPSKKAAKHFSLVGQKVTSDSTFLTPVSKTPLDLFLSIDASDPLLNCKWKHRIQLFYTFRSTICFDHFQYISFGTHLEWLSFSTNESRTTDLDDAISSKETFLHHSLRPVRPGVEAITRMLNNNERISDHEKMAYALDTGRFAHPEVGGYPIVDVVNQIFGTAFLCQRSDTPQCNRCHKDMEFIASMTRSDKLGIDFIFPDGQVMFFGCVDCNAIDAHHVC